MSQDGTDGPSTDGPSTDRPSTDENDSVGQGTTLGSIKRKDLITALTATFVRLVAGFLLIIVMMRLVPNEAGGSLVLPVLVALCGIVGYVFFFRRQLRGISRAKYPGLRATEALILAAAMFLAIFAMIYVMISESNTASFTEPLDRFTAYYFALTVLATVGFGDITPVNTFARSVTMVQMALDLAFIAVLVRVMTGAAKRAMAVRQHRTNPSDEGERHDV